MWASREKQENHLEKKESVQRKETRYILRSIPRLGSSLETTIAAVSEEDDFQKQQFAGRLRQLQKSNIKAMYRNPKEKNLYYFIHATCAQHPEIGKWFADTNTSQTIRDDVERLYTLLLGEIQGKRPEYLMTALCTLVYDAHDLPFDPPEFLKDINMKTYIEYYKFIWNILAKRKITTLRGPKNLIAFKKRAF